MLHLITFIDELDFLDKTSFNKTWEESKGKTKYDTFYFTLKSKHNHYWKWHWWCVWINLFNNYIKYTQFLGKGSGSIA